MPKRGRPIDPTSERARKPWEGLGMSRATYNWKKRYGDLPVPTAKLALKYRPDFTTAINRKLTAAQARQLKQELLEYPYELHPLLTLAHGGRPYVDEATLSDILNERTHKDIVV